MVPQAKALKKLSERSPIEGLRAVLLPGTIWLAPPSALLHHSGHCVAMAVAVGCPQLTQRSPRC